MLPERAQISLSGGEGSRQRTWAFVGEELACVAWKMTKARFRDRGAGDTGQSMLLKPSGSVQFPWRTSGAMVSSWNVEVRLPEPAVNLAGPGVNGRKYT